MEKTELLALCLAFVGGAGATFAGIRGFWPRHAERIAAAERVYAETLKDLFIHDVKALNLARLKYLGPGAVLVLSMLVLQRPVIALGLGIGTWFLADLWVSRQRKLRQDRLGQQVLDVMSAITATTKAGMNLQESVQEIANKLPPPVSQEFSMICERVRAGQTLDAAMAAADHRIDLPGYNLLFQGLAVQREKGGRLSDLLDRTAHALREMDQLDQKVKSQTSGIKLAAKVMVFMPVVLAVILGFMDPSHTDILLNHPLGNVVLVVIATLDIIGFMMLRKLAEPDI